MLYFEVVAATVVVMFCSIPLVLAKSGVLRTVNGAASCSILSCEQSKAIWLAKLLMSY